MVRRKKDQQTGGVAGAKEKGKVEREKEEAPLSARSDDDVTRKRRSAIT